ncbi:MAG: KH domain-containing protein [Clostridiales bacterium]|nr:KH domain-containing protein [Clostridiales bacterium]
MDYIEMTGKTINEAVEKGREFLGLDFDQVDWDILEEPRKGFLGIGARDAKVIVKRAGFDIEAAKKAEEEKAAKKAAEEAKKKAEAERRAKAEEERKAAEAAKAAAKAAAEAERKAKAEAEKKAAEAKKSAESERKTKAKAETKPKKEAAKKEAAPAAAVENKAQNTEETAEETQKVEINTEKAVADATVFLKQFFETMNLKVEIEKKDESGRQLYLDLTGDDMGVIIGKRGQTLDSLQYLTNLVVNKGNSPYISIHLDTKDYRKKRKETLENLARNLAKKAKHIRRNVILEPMSPYERRIIHSTLQNDRYVTTFSEGVEPYRHVVISPKYK